jgi:UDP-N-acetylglucosamine 2-epimerase (non-hydrolysing)
MKAEPVISALASIPEVEQKLVHTGQHYDANMSEVFFRQLGLAEPEVNLDVGSGTQSVQTANIMTRFEEYIADQKTDLVLVYGDVNSTLASSLVCTKLGIPVAHVEAGLRSFDRSMPEEINRVVTDQISELLLTPSVDGDENLIREGIPPHKIHFVGNVMIDSLARLLPQAEQMWPELSCYYRVRPGSYGLVTLHRPSNVDDPVMLRRLMENLQTLAKDLPLIFPMHPRTRRNLSAFGLEQGSAALHVIDPVGYLEFLAFQKNAAVVITDSGGIQEESTYLGIPCITMRQNTERPVTVLQGTNHLVGQNMEMLGSIFGDVLSGNVKKGAIPPLWDGQAGERIARVLVQWFGRKVK